MTRAPRCGGNAPDHHLFRQDIRSGDIEAGVTPKRASRQWCVRPSTLRCLKMKEAADGGGFTGLGLLRWLAPLPKGYKFLALYWGIGRRVRSAVLNISAAF